MAKCNAPVTFNDNNGDDDDPLCLGSACDRRKRECKSRKVLFRTAVFQDGEQGQPSPISAANHFISQLIHHCPHPWLA